jgi:hypothetical protein
VCLRGASEVHEALLARDASQKLRAYVVWVPKTEGAREDVADAMDFVPDARARHFWDGQGALMAAYTRVLGLSEDAWDIYMVYGPDARWPAGATIPPVPAYWMHQLGEREAPRVHGPYLDPGVFAARVRDLLDAAP